MARKPVLIHEVNVKEGMPPVEEALRRLETALRTARAQKRVALRVIHGYGSHGVGGDVRIAVQGRLRQLQQGGELREVIYGEDWRVSDEATWRLLGRYPEWKQDRDLGRGNKGISIVML